MGLRVAGRVVLGRVRLRAPRLERGGEGAPLVLERAREQQDARRVELGHLGRGRARVRVRV